MMSGKVSPGTSENGDSPNDRITPVEEPEGHERQQNGATVDASFVEPTVEGRGSLDSEENLIKGPPPARYDVVLWMFGLLFLTIIQALMFGIGSARGWDALTPYNHNHSNNSQERFLPEPFTPEPGVPKRSDPGASGRWYYWKCKPEDVTAWTKIFVWAAFSLHNLSVWFVLYLQHREKAFALRSAKYTNTPSKYNYIMFGLNAFFHLLHLLNTHTTYDGTAADVSIASSQSSVIVALILMLAIEIQERGIILGFPTTKQVMKHKSSIWLSPMYLVRKYHGYFIYWAAIYTFWYHPMENTIGHAFGFTHTFFMMLQGSLAFQKVHLNKYWRLLLEVWVAIHGGVVAVQTQSPEPGKELWPMFVFGFLTVLFLTQLYGLAIWKQLPLWAPVIPLISYLVFAVSCYQNIKDTEGRSFTRLDELIRIPGIYYLILLVSWLLVVPIMKIDAVVQQRFRKSSEEKQESGRPTILRQIIVAILFTLCYVIMSFISWIFEFYDLKVQLFILTVVYCFAFTVLGMLGFYLLKFVIPLKKSYS